MTVTQLTSVSMILTFISNKEDTKMTGQLTNEELIVLNSEVERCYGKSPVVAFLLALFLGTFGAHRFDMGKTGSGIAMLLITLLLGWIGGIFVTGIRAFIDMFLVFGWVKQGKAELENQVTNEILMRRGE